MNNSCSQYNIIESVKHISSKKVEVATDGRVSEREILLKNDMTLCDDEMHTHSEIQCNDMHRRRPLKGGRRDRWTTHRSKAYRL